MTKTKQTTIAVLALTFFFGTVGAMETGSLSMLHGTIRCVALLCVAAWGTMGRHRA